MRFISLFLFPLAACSVDAPSQSHRDRAADDPPMAQAAPTQGASCVGLPTTCGGTDSCCASPAVAAGTYFRSYDAVGDAQSGAKSFPGTVSSFRLDKYETTVGRFRKFVQSGQGTQGSAPAAGSGAHANTPGSGWDAAWNGALAADQAALQKALSCDPGYQTWSDAPGANENRPINCVSWYEAMAFCIWDGGYLPTENEWNYAAAGGDEQRAYPWSSPPRALDLDSAHAAYYDGSSCGPGQTACPGVVDVGTKPLGDGRFGQSDLAGNVWEFTLDVYFHQYTLPCTDCVTTNTAEDFHTIRGGSARDTSLHLRTARRQFSAPRVRARDIGFRCARMP